MPLSFLFLINMGRLVFNHVTPCCGFAELTTEGREIPVDKLQASGGPSANWLRTPGTHQKAEP